MSQSQLFAAVYSRISHDPEGHSLGVERQEADAGALLRRRGWAVGPVYRENDTAASTLTRTKRPQYEQLLADVDAGRVHVIVAYSTSRLTRRPAEYERLMDLVSRRGLLIETVVSGTVNLSTADGRAVARILAAMDAAEAERTGERISRASRQRAENGHWHGGPIPPYGYAFRRHPAGQRTLVVNPVRAALVQEAAARVLAGDSLYSICKDWNSRGLSSSAGKPWRSQAVRRLLMRPAAAGMNERDGRLFPGSWVPILQRPTWDALRTLLDDPKRNTRTFEQRSHRYPMAGLLFCQGCGHMMSSQPTRYGPSFVCSSRSNGGCGHVRIRADDLERYLLEACHQRARLAAVGTDRPPTDQEIRADLRVQALRAQLHAIQDDHYDNLLDRAAFLRQTARFKALISDSLREGTHTPPAPEASEATCGISVTSQEEDRRWLLRSQIARAVIGAHPPGSTRPGADWASRSANMAARCEIQWHAGT